MSSPDDPFSTLLKKTLDANYNPLISQKEEGTDRLKPSLPLSFYDRHIASHLVLKNVVYLPSITQSLAKTCDTSLQNFFHAGGRFYSAGYNIFPLQCSSIAFTDATSVSSHYHQLVGDVSTRYAYKFSFQPDDHSWDSPISMSIYTEDARPNFKTEAWLEVTELILTDPELLHGLSGTAKDRIKGLLKKYPRLASWDIFAMTEKAKEMSQTLRGNHPFEWVFSRTLGSHTVSRLSPPPDAKNSLISIPTVKGTSVKRGLSGSRRVTTKISKTITVPNLVPRDKPYRPDFRHYIQHAWAKAAVYDSTFIILHCGRYERIGFRHRASRTLFLSGIIDTVNIRNPSYRKLHIGLHTAIVLDALERQELTDKLPTEKIKSGLKRSADPLDSEGPNPKRLKKTSTTKLARLQIAAEIANRKLALVRLEYGAFCSPAPSSFVRRCPSCLPGHAPLTVDKEETEHPSQTRYNASEYFSLTLGEPIGHGAVGVVHGARLELSLDNGETLTHDLVVKLAFTTEQQKMMAKEYAIYGHLSRKKGVEGIIMVHGLFLDPETRTLGMLMDNGGCSLRSREIERGIVEKKALVTGKERKAFLKALKSIHRAGVRHNDIRAENLLVNSRDEVFIIDFDLADYNVYKEDIQKETDWLEDVLDGLY